MKSGLYYIEYIFEGEHSSEYVYVTPFGVTRLSSDPNYGDNLYNESLQEYVDFYDCYTWEKVL